MLKTTDLRSSWGGGGAAAQSHTVQWAAKLAEK
jgi:hypothetical protein